MRSHRTQIDRPTGPLWLRARSCEARPACRDRVAARSAMTLIEILLALTIALVVMGTLLLGVQTTMVALERHQRQIEETQIARAVIARIASDIRCTVIPEEPELEGLDSIEGGLSGLGGDLAGLDPSMLPEGTLPEGTGDLAGAMSGLSGSSSSSSSSSTTTASPLPKVGLRGSATLIELDVSRLPRIDEYQGIVRGTVGVVDIPSDVKTVMYALRSDPGLTSRGMTGDILADSGVTGAELPGGGLIRVELDRAVMLHATLSGSDMTSAGYEELLAPEVIDLQFRYFDGSAWLTDWDTETSGRLPKAVEIQLVVDPTVTRLTPEERAERAAYDPNATNTGNVIYRQVVAIPAALDDPPEIIPPETMEVPSESSSGSGSSGSGSSSGGSSGSGSAGGGTPPAAPTGPPDAGGAPTP